MIESEMPTRPQYVYIAHDMPVLEAFDLNAPWLAEDGTVDELEYTPVGLDRTSVQGGRFFMCPWTPKKPLVQQYQDEPRHAPRHRYRIGMLAGQISVPDDFDTMFRAEIEDMFGL